MAVCVFLRTFIFHGNRKKTQVVSKFRHVLKGREVVRSMLYNNN